jgi:hypothetical protein
VNKPHRGSSHEHITHVGGPTGLGRWKDSVESVIVKIETGIDRFYVLEDGASVWVGVRKSATGRKFLQTHADGVWKNNLLALDECA